MVGAIGITVRNVDLRVADWITSRRWSMFPLSESCADFGGTGFFVTCPMP